MAPNNEAQVMNDRYYTGLKEVKLVTTVDEVNKLLAQGWEYLKSHDINDANQVNTRIHWEMGKFGEVKEKVAPPSSPKPASNASVSAILALPWEPSQFSDAWVPYSKVPKAISDFIQKNGEKTSKGYKVVAGNYDVYLSTAGNLQRFKPK